MNLEHVVTISIPTPFPVGSVNAYLVRSEPVTLIDAGVNTDEAFDVLRSVFQREKLILSDLKRVFLTHTHIDHVGLLGRLREHADFTIHGHREAAHQRLNSPENEKEDQRFALGIMREFGTPEEIVRESAREQQTYREYATDAIVDEGLEDGEVIGQHVAYHVPGHSAMDMLFADQEAHLGFTGDHLLPRITPNPLLRRPKSGQPRAKSLLEYRKSLRKTQGLDIDICYPGHGEPIRNPREAIENLLQRQDKRNQRILEILGSRRLSVYQVARALFPRMDPKFTFLGLSSAAGHLEVLEEEGRVISEYQDGILCFRRV